MTCKCVFHFSWKVIWECHYVFKFKCQIQLCFVFKVGKTLDDDVGEANSICLFLDEIFPTLSVA